METRVPKISVGFPVYNGEKYLPNSLPRLLRQDYLDFELVICDNASTDRTQEICLAFAAQDPRVRYFRNEKNVGLAANHNRTFELSRGQYFKWAAHDDDFPVNMLSGLVKVMDQVPASVCMVYSYCEYVDESGQPMWVDSDHVNNPSRWPHKRLSHFLRNVHMYNCPYGLIRSDVLRKTRLYGLFPGSDHVLFAELAMLGEFIEIPEPLLRIRKHSGRTFTANKDPKALRELFTPGRGSRFLPISLRTHMELELIRGALVIPLSLRDRVLCTLWAVCKPQWENFRAFGGRQKAKLLGRPLQSASNGPAGFVNLRSREQ
jgi:glycosyltransferase involved in cell wall biosynthesis